MLKQQIKRSRIPLLSYQNLPNFIIGLILNALLIKFIYIALYIKENESLPNSIKCIQTNRCIHRLGCIKNHKIYFTYLEVKLHFSDLSGWSFYIYKRISKPFGIFLLNYEIHSITRLLLSPCVYTLASFTCRNCLFL